MRRTVIAIGVVLGGLPAGVVGASTPPTDTETTAAGPPATMPSGDEVFPGYPLIVDVSTIDSRVANAYEGSLVDGQVVALAPGVYTPYNPLVPDLESYMDGGSDGDCAARDRYFPETGGSCWSGVLPGSDEPTGLTPPTGPVDDGDWAAAFIAWAADDGSDVELVACVESGDRAVCYGVDGATDRVIAATYDDSGEFTRLEGQVSATTTTTATTTATTTPASTSSSGGEDPEALAQQFVPLFNRELSALADLAPATPAAAYFEGLAIVESSAPSGNVDARAVRGGIQFTGGGPFIDNFVVDAEGRLVDFDREGTPVSQSIHLVNQQFTAGNATGLVHSVRRFDGNVQIVFSVTNNGADGTATLYFDDYAVDGGQVDVTYLSTNADARPGATVGALYTWEGQPGGGTIYGSLSHDGGGGFEFVDVEIAVPAELGG